MVDSDEEANEEEFSPPFFETVEVADRLYSFGNGEAFGGGRYGKARLSLRPSPPQADDRDFLHSRR